MGAPRNKVNLTLRAAKVCANFLRSKILITIFLNFLDQLHANFSRSKILFTIFLNFLDYLHAETNLWWYSGGRQWFPILFYFIFLFSIYLQTPSFHFNMTVVIFECICVATFSSKFAFPTVFSNERTYTHVCTCTNTRRDKKCELAYSNICQNWLQS